MSRIEKAMEKASQLRQGIVPTLEVIKPICDDKVHSPSFAAVVGKKIVSANPLLVTLNDPHSPAAEEYRKLKSVLVKITRGDTFKNSIMITSALPNEGKSITALNLAISLAQEFDHTVLLVDADLRRPSIHRYLDIPQGRGLADCLIGETDISETIIATGIGKLSLVTGGCAVDNPAELISSQKMKKLVNDMKHRYSDRYLIFDTPPILPFAETRSLSHLVDGVIFVVKERLASQGNVKEAIDALKGCEIFGMVYNNVSYEYHDERYSYYRGYDLSKSKTASV